MNAYQKPIPPIDALSKPYWDAAKNHELRLPKCDDCGHLRVQFERWCPHCSSDHYTWARMNGRGRVWSHCRFHRAYFKSFEPELPYNVSIVELSEGARLITNVVGIDAKDVRIGLPVEVFFDDVTPDLTLIKFKPTAAGT